MGVDSREGGDAYLNERSLIFSDEMVGGRERVTTDGTTYSYVHNDGPIESRI